MKPIRLFKGPLFPSRRNTKPTRTLTDLPVGRGNIDESDFLNEKSGRPTRKDLDMQRKCKENKKDE